VEEGRIVGGCGAEVDLGVIGIAVEIHFEVTKYLTKGEDINDKEEGAKNRALGNALGDCGCNRCVIMKRDEV